MDLTCGLQQRLYILDIGAEYAIKTENPEFIKNTGWEEHLPKCSPMNNPWNFQINMINRNSFEINLEIPSRLCSIDGGVWQANTCLYSSLCSMWFVLF